MGFLEVFAIFWIFYTRPLNLVIVGTFGYVGQLPPVGLIVGPLLPPK